MFKIIKVVFVERFLASVAFLWFSFRHFLFLFSLVQPRNWFILLKRFLYEKILFPSHSDLLYIKEKSSYFSVALQSLLYFNLQGFNRLRGFSHGR